MSNRIQQVNQVIKEEISKIIFREIDFPKNIMVTITRVETLVNLREAKIYVSVIPEEEINKILRILERQIYNLQQKLNKRIQMRPIPKIKFLPEKETSQAGKIEEILERLKKEKK